MLLSGTFAFPSSWNATNCVGDELTVALRIAKGKWERMNNFLHGSRPAEITQLWHPPDDPKMGVRWIHKGGRIQGCTRCRIELLARATLGHVHRLYGHAWLC